MYFLYRADMCVENVCLIWKFHSLNCSHTDFNKRILSNTWVYLVCRRERVQKFCSSLSQEENLGSLANGCFLFEVIVSKFWLRVVSLDFSSSTWGRIHDFVMLGAVLRSRAFRHMAAQPSFVLNEIIANPECDL